MGKNLKDYANNKINATPEQMQSAEQKAKEMLNKYKDMSKDDLMTEFENEVLRQKQNGTFDKNKLQNMLDSVRFLIPNDKYEQVKQVLESL